MAIKILKRTSIILDGTIDRIADVAAGILALGMFAVLVNVTLRVLRMHTIQGMTSILGISMLFITFLGATWVLKREKHITVDILLSRLRPRAQAVLNFVTSTISAIVCLVIVWYGAVVTWGNYQSGYFKASELNIPEAYVVFIIPLGGLFLSIQFIRRSYGYWRSWREPPN